MEMSSSELVSAAYAEALVAAEVLRGAFPDHELLRLVKKNDPNLDQTINEIVGRFWDGDKSPQDNTARSVIEFFCYRNLIKAMLVATKGIPKIVFTIEGFRVGTNESVLDVFLVVLSVSGEENTIQMTLSTKNELISYVCGIEALAGLQGLEIDIQEIPKDFTLVPVDLTTLGGVINRELGLHPHFE